MRSHDINFHEGYCLKYFLLIMLGTKYIIYIFKTYAVMEDEFTGALSVDTIYKNIIMLLPLQ